MRPSPRGAKTANASLRRLGKGLAHNAFRCRGAGATIARTDDPAEAAHGAPPKLLPFGGSVPFPGTRFQLNMEADRSQSPACLGIGKRNEIDCKYSFHDRHGPDHTAFVSGRGTKRLGREAPLPHRSSREGSSFGDRRRSPRSRRQSGMRPRLLRCPAPQPGTSETLPDTAGLVFVRVRLRGSSYT